MAKTTFVSFRITEDERIRLKQLSEQTGLGISEVLRSLIHSAHVEPVQSFRAVSAGIETKKNTRKLG